MSKCSARLGEMQCDGEVGHEGAHHCHEGRSVWTLPGIAAEDAGQCEASHPTAVHLRCILRRGHEGQHAAWSDADGFGVHVVWPELRRELPEDRQYAQAFAECAGKSRAERKAAVHHRIFGAVGLEGVVARRVAEDMTATEARASVVAMALAASVLAVSITSAAIAGDDEAQRAKHRAEVLGELLRSAFLQGAAFATGLAADRFREGVG